MPTAAKLTAAIFFALLGWFSGDLVKAVLPEGARTGLINETLAALGAVSGSMMSGRRAGDGYRASFGYGLTTAALITFWGIFSFAGYEMLQRSLDRRYDGAIEALQEMVSLGLEYSVLIAVPSIIGTIIVGGLFGGWLTEWVAKRWS